MKSPFRRGVERMLSRALATTFAATMRRLPLPWVRALGRALGSLIFLLTWRRQRLADENLLAVFGDRFSPKERRRIRLRCTQNIAMLFGELFKMPSMGAEGIREAVPFIGLEKVHAAVAKGRGVVLVTAHFGNWEIGGARLAADGIDMAVVARDASDAGVASIINGCREAVGMRVLGRHDLRAMMKHLRRKGALAILPDQHHKRGALRQEFLGRPAWVAPGPATMAVRLGCPIVPLFSHRAEDGSLSAEAYDEIEVDDNADRDTAIAITTQRVSDAIGDAIRRDPAQWLWLHDRWKDTQRGVDDPPPEDVSRGPGALQA